MAIRTPREITEATLAIGQNKCSMSMDRLLVQSILAGAFIAFGGILSLIVGQGFPEVTAGNPALCRLLSGVMFPVGLLLVVVLGAELFTGNNALLIPGAMRGQIGAGRVMRNWAVVYFGNFIGALLFMVFLVYMSELTAVEPYRSASVRMATTKVSLGWGVVLLRGIGANWCVCLAVWLALAGHSLIEKAVGCFLPVMAFVVLGYEHCVANMFFIPLGMANGADVTVWEMVWDNLIPATIGNIIGGALLVGCVNSYLHLRGEKK